VLAVLDPYALHAELGRGAADGCRGRGVSAYGLDILDGQSRDKPE
jgi:hypothetical protein